MQAPEEKTAASEVFDIETALSRVRGKNELLKRLVHIFLQELPQTMSSIRTAVNSGDILQLQLSAHRLKGAASTISAVRVARISEDIERMAGTGELTDMESTFRSLEEHVAELIFELEFFGGDRR